MPIQPLFGSCLDAKWVEDTQKRLGISAESTDDLGRREHPSLHKARSAPRYRVEDKRTAGGDVFSADCMPEASWFQGINTTFDANGTLISSGTADGALVIELNLWTTHTLTSFVFAIIASEIAGFPIAFFLFNDIYTVERMSSQRGGRCTPVHINLEVWTDTIKGQYCSNESYLAGESGYRGISGVYTTKEFIAKGQNGFYFNQTFDADFWRDYKRSDPLIEQLAASKFFNDTEFYDVEYATSMCPNGSMGCLNGCAKSYACTLREQQGKECLVLTLIDPYSDVACVYFPAVLSNLDIPAYFCFIGMEPNRARAVAMQQQHKPVFFYYWEPDTFNYLHPDVFTRVLLPQYSTDRYALSSGTFGENGYGQPTNNGVDVDYPSMSLLKYGSTLLTENDNLQFLVSQFSISDTHLDSMMKAYTAQLLASDRSIDNPQLYFNVSCNWVKDNFEVWQSWLKRLPLCNLMTHIKYEIEGCDLVGTESTTTTTTTTTTTDSSWWTMNGPIHTIHFSWEKPDPIDPMLPDECDGGLMTLPDPLSSSRSCAFLTTSSFIWLNWIAKKPDCDRSFYTFNVSNCEADGTRVVHYFWWLPDPVNETSSLECADAVPSILPQRMHIACEYVPITNANYIAACLFAGFFAILYAAGIVFIHKHRDNTVIKHSQSEVLMLMLLGGILMCAASVAYGGKPSIEICAWRPLLASLGYTTVFGALLLKSIRVYRIFSLKAMKRRVITKRHVFSWLAILYAVDVLLLGVWAVVDFPYPRYQSVQVVGLNDGTISQLGCRSHSNVYSVLLIFWKALLLIMGGALAFMIRKIPSNFQESFWIFCSVLVVIVFSVIVLPMAYLVQMAAIDLFVFMVGAFLLGTFLVMALMLVPKLYQMKKARAFQIESEETGGSENNLDASTRTLSQGSSALSSAMAPSNKQVKLLTRGGKVYMAPDHDGHDKEPAATTATAPTPPVPPHSSVDKSQSFVKSVSSVPHRLS